MNCTTQEELLSYRDGAVGRMRLNRQRALHTLTLEMCRAMMPFKLLGFDTDNDSVFFNVSLR